MIRQTRSGSFLLGAILMGLVLAACGSATWQTPFNWTLREDNKIRASQRKEVFTFAEWKAAYLDKEGAKHGILITPAGAKEITDELARRNAKILELENKLRNCR